VVVVRFSSCRLEHLPLVSDKVHRFNSSRLYFVRRARQVAIYRMDAPSLLARRTPVGPSRAGKWREGVLVGIGLRSRRARAAVPPGAICHLFFEWGT